MIERGHARTWAGILVTVAGASCTSGTPPPADPAPPPPGVAVEVQPPYAAVAMSGSRTFQATVSGTADVAVTWSVEPAGCGTVAAIGAGSGRFTAPASPGTCRVRATSVGAPERSGYAAVTVTPAEGGGVCGAAAGQLFPRDAPWNTPVDAAPVDAESARIVAYLAANHTAAARFQITFDFNILYADASVARRSFARTGNFFSPDCDPAPMPVPPGGRLEGEQSYACSGGDCHLTVVDTSSCRLWEMWVANIPNGLHDGPGFEGGCLAIWDLSTTPPATGRGDQCSSADAGGLPILPLVFTADEVASGTIDHAIRFVLPNALIRRLVYVRPGTHSTGATGGGADAPPYAARFRLKKDKDLSSLGAGAQVVARALQMYGMVLADAGNITFTAATDDLTANRWAEVGLGSQSLRSLSWTDFEVVELGERFTWGTGTGCTRTPISP